MEHPTVAHHPGLRGSRRRNPIPSARGRARRINPNHTHANVISSPESTAVRSYLRVPRIQLVDRDAVVPGDNATLIA